MNETLTTCPLCNSSIKARLFLSCQDEFVTRELFHVEQCSECGFLYTNPRPNTLNISAYYKSKAYISHQEKPASFMDKLYLFIRRVMMRRKARLISSLVPEGSRLLDVGCGTGTFLETMKLEGYIVQGVEPAEIPRKIAQSKGIQVVNNIYSVNPDLKQEHDSKYEVSDSLVSNSTYGQKNSNEPIKPPMQSGLFSCISLWHVLEHMHDFKEQLNSCHELLTKYGYLIIALPMYKSFDAAYYKKHWAAYDLPRHLYHFDNISLKTTVELSGFSIKKIKTLPFDSYYVSMLSESYRKSMPVILGYLRAMAIGLISNLAAVSGRRPASSQIFICQKKR